ncbi:hypothetical protein [Sphingomonas sp. 1P08PE]|uniref:hypothetical protein n=1 Tax=Sphingomonas sp. 1P08PE TaxID=554122 RepID=UPI0039A3AE12
MTDIKFARDYGYAPGAPFWLVWNEDGRSPVVKHASRDVAEAEAARLASVNMGRTFHVLAVMSSITTSAEVVGTRFDPSRAHYPDVEVAAPLDPPAPAFVSAEDEVAF